MISRVIDLAGIAVILILAVSSVSGIVEKVGGSGNFTNQTLNDPDFRNNAVMYELATGFVSPVYPLMLGNAGAPGSPDSPYYIVVDGMTMLIILAASLGVAKVVGIVFGEVGFLTLAIAFLIAFIGLSLIWQAYWIQTANVSGAALGLTQEQIYQDIYEPSLADNQWLLYLVAFSSAFVLWKGRGAF